MIALTMLAVAAATPAPANAASSSEAAPPPRNFLKGAESRACAPGATSGEVVVCGRRDAQEAYRVRPLDDAKFGQQPLRAEAKVFGNGKLTAHGEQASVGGFTAPRAKVTLSLPF